MANIRKEANRHKWRRQRIGLHGKYLTKEMWLCTNCQAQHDETQFGDPPVQGCMYDVDMMKLGKSRMDDIEERVINACGTPVPDMILKKGY